VSQPFDAVLLIAFGGPQGPDDIRPFLGNVLRGRRVSPDRVEEVAHHYELFGGVSPLTALTARQAAGLQRTLAERGVPLKVYVGMRNWHPYLTDTLADMSRDGVRRAIAFVAAAHRSYSGCLQYKENVVEARNGLLRAGLADVGVTYVGDWHLHEGFIAANAEHVREALARLSDVARDHVEIVFTAHSIPVAMAERYPYEQQVRETAAAVMRRLGRPGTPAVVFQSRSGRPEDPWLAPDVCDYLKEAKDRGVPGVVLSPIGFLCDHVEVLYDLDVEAADVCRGIDLPMARAAAVNDHPLFLETMTEAVLDVVERYARGRPLPVVKP
jgi:ferrochelatase